MRQRWGPCSPRWLAPPSIVPATSSTDAAPGRAAFVCTCATPDGGANLMDGHSGRSYAQVVGGRASARSRRRAQARRKPPLLCAGAHSRRDCRAARIPERRTVVESCTLPARRPYAAEDDGPQCHRRGRRRGCRGSGRRLRRRRRQRNPRPRLPRRGARRRESWAREAAAAGSWAKPSATSPAPRSGEKIKR